jgi:predicted nucleic acid-binding protein
MRYRIYVDTSVIGGCLDDEFAEDSLRLFQMARDGKLILLLSDVVIGELADAPDEVSAILENLPETVVQNVPISEDVRQLRDAYLEAGIVGENWIDDATHVAAAAVAHADAIVSWNFKHIVRIDKIRAYNEINQRFGYKPIMIVCPKEVPDEK